MRVVLTTLVFQLYLGDHLRNRLRESFAKKQSKQNTFRKCWQLFGEECQNNRHFKLRAAWPLVEITTAGWIGRGEDVSARHVHIACCNSLGKQGAAARKLHEFGMQVELRSAFTDNIQDDAIQVAFIPTICRSVTAVCVQLVSCFPFPLALLSSLASDPFPSVLSFALLALLSSRVPDPLPSRSPISLSMPSSSLSLLLPLRQKKLPESVCALQAAVPAASSAKH